MIEYKKKILANGLTVVVNRDPVSKLAAVNILYKVGARNENPERTGFAHLFEHLMFRGTRRIPNFDLPVQMACGDNNAFTNNDYTDFYITLPKDNVETALWLESDRMEGLDITPEKLETEKRVVIEEFRQRYLNQPYGDQPMLLRALAYKVHPYRWATIGLTPEHIAQATPDEVQAFYRAHYRPSNAILSISADIDEEKMLDLAEKWFEPLANRPAAPDHIRQEPVQTANFPLKKWKERKKEIGTKNHKKVDGKLLRTDKQFRHLKQRQKETISTWLYEEYRRLWIEKGQEPHKRNNREIVAAVMERIEAAGIWLPEQEVTKYFYRRKTHYRNRIEKELQPKPEMQDKDSQTQKEQGAGSQ